MEETGGALGKGRSQARRPTAAQGTSLSARLQAAMAAKEDERRELADQLAQQQGQLGERTGALATRMRRSLGGQPLGSVRVCIAHRWDERREPPRRVCLECGLVSIE